MPSIRTIPGDGPTRNPTLFIVGERPGFEEHRAGRPFVGPAGEELWAHLYRLTGVEREACYVTNLVKSFSREPPDPSEVVRDAPLLERELALVQPRTIMTVGYHAGRYFLPQYAEVNGDVWHGLPHHITSRALPKPGATLIPCCHSAAALRQPARYQNQFASDVAMVARVLAGEWVPRPPLGTPPLARVGLASLMHATRPVGGLDQRGDAIIGLDTEGSLTHPPTCEALTLSASDREATLVQPDVHPHGLPHVQTVLDTAGRLTIHNATHDLKALWALGLTVSPRVLDDTMVMAYLLDLPRGLKTLMFRLFGWQMGDYTDLVQPVDDARVKDTLQSMYSTYTTAWETYAAAVKVEKKRARIRRRRPYPLPEPDFPKRALASLKGILTKPAESTPRARWEGSTFAASVPLPPPATWKDAPAPARDIYAMTDALAHRALRGALWPRIVEQGLARVYRMDMAVVPLLARNEYVGLACDEKILHGLTQTFESNVADLLARIETLVGFPINPNSPDDVSRALFEELDVTPTRLLPKSGNWTTQDKYLKARRHEHAVIQLILDVRQLKKYLGTYTRKLPGMLVDGRYHPDWGYTVTATGRLVEQVILLIPKHDPRAKEEQRLNRAKAIRNAFHATDGHALVSVDLSQIELRAMADLSQDPRLLHAFRTGVDMHAQVAHDVLGAPVGKENQDESKHRLPAKTINFGIINGMTEYGMVDQLHEQGQLHWTLSDVQDMLKDWFRVHKGVKAYWTAQIRLNREQGFSTNKFGRRRVLNGLHSTDDRIVAEAERQCLWPIQSTADDISKKWNAAIWRDVIRPAQRAGRYCEPWVRVHDDTTLEADTRDAKDTGAAMLALVPQDLKVPTTAEMKTAQRWGEL